MNHAGYEYLLAYKLTIPIYDYTVVFCNRWISYRSRTHDQMVQAARSGMQNISEGYVQEGKKGYIKLSGVARGSLEELLKDYSSYGRQNRLEIWEKDKCMREIREIGEIWDILKKSKVLPHNPHFPDLPYNREVAINLMITIIHQANYLLDKLIASIIEKHKREGGLAERLYRERKAFRGY